MAGQNVLPVVIGGEYRADGAFRMLGRDLFSARTQLTQSKTEMVSLAGAATKVNLSVGQLGQSVTLAGRRSGAFGGSLGQLSFQINDIASGLLMGQSPFQIMAQQGGQVLQVWQMNNNVFKELKTAIANVITPGRAMVLGFGAAAGAAYLLYKAVNDNGPTAEQTLEEQGRLLSIVKTAYADAAVAAGKFYDQSKSIVTLQAQQNIIALQNQLRSQTGSALKTMTSPTSLPSDIPLPPGTQAIENATVGASAFRELNRVIEDFNAGAQDAAAVAGFRDLVGAIGAAAAATNPELARTANELLNNTKAMGDMALATLKAEAALRLLTGTATDQDRKLLGLSVKVSVNAYDQLIQRTKDRNTELKEEADQAGRTGNAVLALKLQHDAERAAKQSGVKVNQQVLDQLKEELVLRTDLKAKAELRADAMFERSQLGRTPGEADIASRLRSANLDPASAAEEAGILRVNQALTETRDLSRDALKGFISDLAASKSLGEATIGVLTRFGAKLGDIAADQAIASLFKPASATSGGGGFGSILAAVFGGFRAGGGDVQAGKGYIVGERGPEWFAPGTSGKIVPDIGRGGGGGAPTIVDQSTNTFNASISGADRNQISSMVDQKVAASEARIMKRLDDQRSRRAA